MALPKWFEENVPAELATSRAFKFSVKLNDKMVEIDLLQDIDVDYDNLEHQMERTPAQYVYWSTMFSELKLRVNVLERKIKARRGVLTDQVIEDYAQRGIKLTDKQHAAILEKDAELNKLEESSLCIQQNMGKLFGMVEAIKLKSEMIRSLSGFKRIELDHSSRQ